jgi:hypothetical protein
VPVHDWTRVDAGVFHDFHNVWIALLRIASNSGLLPEGFYAMSEPHAGKYIADMLTLHSPGQSDVPSRAIAGGVALADTPPKLRHHSFLMHRWILTGNISRSAAPCRICHYSSTRKSISRSPWSLHINRPGKAPRNLGERCWNKCSCKPKQEYSSCL